MKLISVWLGRKLSLCPECCLETVTAFLSLCLLVSFLEWKAGKITITSGSIMMGASFQRVPWCSFLVGVHFVRTDWLELILNNFLKREKTVGLS